MHKSANGGTTMKDSRTPAEWLDIASSKNKTDFSVNRGKNSPPVTPSRSVSSPLLSHVDHESNVNPAVGELYKPDELKLPSRVFSKRVSISKTGKTFSVINYGDVDSTIQESRPKVDYKDNQVAKPESQYDYVTLDIPETEKERDDYSCSQKLSLGAYNADSDSAFSSQEPMPDAVEVTYRESSFMKNDRRGWFHSPISTYVNGVLARRGRLFARRKVNRVIEKSGEYNLAYTNVQKRNVHYLIDIFTTLIDLRWRYAILLFIMAFGVSWLVFGLLWWAIISIRRYTLPDADPCVQGVHDFVTALLFSIETQHTIGYGTRAVTSSCPPVVLALMLQSVVGVLIQCVMAGLVFAKLSRAKRRGQTILFSRKAVICKRRDAGNCSREADADDLCLMFRVGDMRRSQLIGSSLRVIMLERGPRSQSGEALPGVQRRMAVETDAQDDFFFLAWPVTVVHRIDGDSPLWTCGAEALLRLDIEIVVILEGIVEATGMTTQVRTSYLPGEILWGHRLAPLSTYLSDSANGYKIDYSSFHEIVPVTMSELSAKQLLETRVTKLDDDDNDESTTKT